MILAKIVHYRIKYIRLSVSITRKKKIIMNEKPYLIVMLTYDDMTVENAYEIQSIEDIQSNL